MRKGLGSGFAGAACVLALALGGCATTSKSISPTGKIPSPQIVAANVGDGDAVPAIPVPTPNPVAKDRVAVLMHSVPRSSCIVYARNRSGIAVRGDARTWWKKAQGIYEEVRKPEVDSVMVFRGTRRMRRGHVAVVTRIVSSREIRVDHANWPGGGRVYANVPVYDVSAANDWSEVRVYDARSGGPGAHVYPVDGFITTETIADNN